MTGLTNAEVTLLGLLSEGPMHPYQLEKEVQGRDMRFWTELSMSSIYKLLNKLEKDLLVDSSREFTEGNRARRVYRISEKGLEQLKAALRILLSEPEHMRWRMDLATSNLTILPREEALACLATYEEKLRALHTCYGELEGYLLGQHTPGVPPCPPHRLALARRPRYLLEGELRWLEAYRAELQNLPA